MGLHCLWGSYVVRKSIPKDWDWWSLKSWVKLSHKKTTLYLRTMFNSESNTQRELKGLALYPEKKIPGFIKFRWWKSDLGSIRHYFHTWIGHHRVQTPMRIFGMSWKRLCVATQLSCHIQDLGEKWIQHWKERNLVTLQRLIQTMSHQLCAMIKSKVGPKK